MSRLESVSTAMKLDQLQECTPVSILERVKRVFGRGKPKSESVQGYSKAASSKTLEGPTIALTQVLPHKMADQSEVKYINGQSEYMTQGESLSMLTTGAAKMLTPQNLSSTLEQPHVSHINIAASQQLLMLANDLLQRSDCIDVLKESVAGTICGLNGHSLIARASNSELLSAIISHGSYDADQDQAHLMFTQPLTGLYKSSSDPFTEAIQGRLSIDMLGLSWNTQFNVAEQKRITTWLRNSGAFTFVAALIWLLAICCIAKFLISRFERLGVLKAVAILLFFVWELILAVADYRRVYPDQFAEGH
jgi:hypothetical protein